nr:hypothetical protein [uncultured Chryseobacterium sp.]
MREGNFSKNTMTILYKRAGEHCCLCKKITTKPHSDPEKFHNLGEAAHICGVKDAPNLRFNEILSLKELKSSRNGIWLCQTCHHIIDNDEKTYTVEKLNEIKSSHEILIVKIQESGESLMPVLNSKDREVRRYQKVISEIEAEMDEKDVLYNEELNKLKFALSTLNKEREFLDDQLSKIKKEIIDLDNEILLKALLEEKDITKALEILDEEKLDHNEIKLAKSRVLRARLLISCGDRKGAEHNFERAFQIWPRFNVAIEYVQLLYFKKLDYTRIIEICELALANTLITDEQITLMESIAMANIKLGKPELAMAKLGLIKEHLNNNEENNAKKISYFATIEKHIGDCFKLLGNLQDSLKSYEFAMNLYFRADFIDKNSVAEKELAGLATAIGLIYEANNNPVEGLIHHLRALEVLEDVSGCNQEKALINLNLATCYLKKKNFDPIKAKGYVLEGIAILSELSRGEPNEFLEYLIGAKCILADISFILKSNEAESLYTESLQLATILFNQNPVFLHALAHVQYNYSIFLIIFKGRLEKGLEILDDSIKKLKNSQIAIFEYTSNLSQALFFKAEMSNNINTKMEILNEILSLTIDLDSKDKSNIWRIKAQILIDNLDTKKK